MSQVLPRLLPYRAAVDGSTAHDPTQFYGSLSYKAQIKTVTCFSCTPPESCAPHYVWAAAGRGAARRAGGVPGRLAGSLVRAWRMYLDRDPVLCLVRWPVRGPVEA